MTTTDLAGLLGPASSAVRALLEPTPLVRAHVPDTEVYFKLETLQPTGSFKVRGAAAAVTAYGTTGERIVTASAGNHGLGIAFAATRLNVPATIFVPASAPAVKLDALGRFDVDLRVGGSSYDDAERDALDYASTHGRFVSAYSDPQVIAGQATLVTEVGEALDGEFTVVVPVGGGGLAAGTAIGAAQLERRVGVVGVEARRSMAVSAAVRAGHVVDVPVGETIADGLAGNIDSDAITPEIIRAHGVTLLDVDEPEIRDAVRQFAVHHGLVAEGSAAVGLAALAAGKVRSEHPVVIVVTGRNITAERLADILTS